MIYRLSYCAGNVVWSRSCALLNFWKISQQTYLCLRVGPLTKTFDKTLKWSWSPQNNFRILFFNSRVLILVVERPTQTAWKGLLQHNKRISIKVVGWVTTRLTRVTAQFLHNLTNSFIKCFSKMNYHRITNSTMVFYRSELILLVIKTALVQKSLIFLNMCSNTYVCITDTHIGKHFNPDRECRVQQHQCAFLFTRQFVNLNFIRMWTEEYKSCHHMAQFHTHVYCFCLSRFSCCFLPDTAIPIYAEFNLATNYSIAERCQGFVTKLKVTYFRNFIECKCYFHKFTIIRHVSRVNKRKNTNSNNTLCKTVTLIR